MRYRNLSKNTDGTYNIVWFKSKGITVERPAIYGTFPIAGRPAFTPKEYPYAICGFSNIEDDGNGKLQSIADFEGEFFDGEIAQLKITADPTKKIYICFYNTDTPADKFYESTFTGSIDINIPLMTGSLTTGKHCSFVIKEGEATNGVLSTISDFLLRIAPEVKKISIDENYVIEQDGIAKSLIQRLGVIKNELWYDYNYGLPLFDKIRNKALMDAAIIQIITDHEEVASIINYSSAVDSKTKEYSFKADILSIFGSTVSISSNYSL